MATEQTTATAAQDAAKPKKTWSRRTPVNPIEAEISEFTRLGAEIQLLRSQEAEKVARFRQLADKISAYAKSVLGDPAARDGSIRPIPVALAAAVANGKTACTKCGGSNFTRNTDGDSSCLMCGTVIYKPAVSR